MADAHFAHQAQYVSSYEEVMDVIIQGDSARFAGSSPQQPVVVVAAAAVAELREGY